MLTEDAPSAKRFYLKKGSNNHKNKLQTVAH